MEGTEFYGQWFFYGTEEDSRCFLVALENRSEAALLPMINKKMLDRAGNISCISLIEIIPHFG